MIPDATYPLSDGVKIVAPDSPHLITPYVLREQQDWFEDEIKFLRRVIEPGWQAIDIGANHGVYTLVIANLAGPAGHVWAFEPASSTARLLAAGVTVNGFSNVTLEQSAVSDFSGTAELSLSDNSELNKLADGAAPDGAVETVSVVTLDQSRLQHGWRGIDFIKLDAEGQEMNVLRGGRDFLASESPLIQYEIKDGHGWHLDLAKEFLALGYHSYRLVPGLDALVPVVSGEQPDSYLLNLFCCKPDRAAQLAARGLLVDSAEIAMDPAAATGADWRSMLTRHPYGAILSAKWDRFPIVGRCADVIASLALYVLAQDSSLPMAVRLAALKTAFENFQRYAAEPTAFLRASSLARIAREYGARDVAITSLRQLCAAIFERRQVDPAEPFLAPGRRSEAWPIPDPKRSGDWLATAALEELELNEFYSSYYSGKSRIGRLEIICNSGFADDEMKRRRDLVYQRFGIQPAT
ncbi:FkbM family methyltransferase [Shumkonia mesophila]|uniref:FkbM family methyltransferase n=1 Tax=Shumkonia mesophila TaxID=2838854 RepID=UPI0029344CBB|nr:FkbM family methyltransferase [Shumkonia mesophila]